MFFKTNAIAYACFISSSLFLYGFLENNYLNKITFQEDIKVKLYFQIACIF